MIHIDLPAEEILAQLAGMFRNVGRKEFIESFT